MINIIKFCEGAETILCNTKEIDGLKDNTLSIEKETTAIQRTRYAKDSSCIFTMELGTPHEQDIMLEWERLLTVSQFYPGIFSYRYNGRHLEVIANIPMIIKYAGAIRRFGNSFNFISLLRKRINKILRLKNLLSNDLTLLVDVNILATGSINLDTNVFCVDIAKTDTVIGVYKRAMTGEVITPEIKQLDMKFWAREINPDMNKSASRYHSEKKYPISDDIMTYYPPCIQRLASQPKKGNYGRFLLSTFLLAVHSEKDAKYQLSLMLTPDENEHMRNGNCKDQWKTIVGRNYSPPSVKTMIDAGHVEDDDEIPPTLTSLEFYGYWGDRT